MNAVLTTLAFAIAAGAAAAGNAPADNAPAGDDGWRPLFNGEDLSGWRANLDPDAFAVEDGLLRVRATGPKRAHLFYVGDAGNGEGNGDGDFERFRNFELEAVVRAEPNSNSGIFFHTDRTLRDAKGHLATGYELQLNSSARERRKTGSLYAVVDLDRSPVDETNWFVVRLAVRDRRITVALDGETVVDYTEPENVERPASRAGRRLSPEGGAIALQAHDPDSVWSFRSIKVRPLP
ncbi:DUF1080 domain-containing protein [Alienimonas sp. DA493]|uniref:3-keto-disaccharide hydrolase n=1 Tax=Alienimonas sp. DA493 TaxID=3373605 RepID=UPI00375447F5